jgi:3'-phosphoadenosine 5'-phosphosulfate sulfotransferase (PAPS reductase)/FAD synthetase
VKAKALKLQLAAKEKFGLNIIFLDTLRTNAETRVAADSL